MTMDMWEAVKTRPGSKATTVHGMEENRCRKKADSVVSMHTVLGVKTHRFPNNARAEFRGYRFGVRFVELPFPK